MPKEIQLDFDQICICNTCGREGRIEVYKTQMILYVFFLPLFRWNTQYYARMSCCGTIVALEDEVGQGIEDGDIVYLNPEIFPYRGEEICPRCGTVVRPEDNYCPHCGYHL